MQRPRSPNEDDDLDSEIRPSKRARIDHGSDSDESEASLASDDAPAQVSCGHSYAGVLSRVKLVNFMSHESFEYNLGKNVNIINGPNGSGKSAIVAAVQIGLGAKASATERGSRIDDHIMHGKDSCAISIQICNSRNPAELSRFRSEGKPPDADDSSTYRWSTYGDAITVERRLHRKSASRWTVKNKSGQNVEQGSTARSEVMNICDHFGFIVDNPVAVLTQSKTKEFLSNAKPETHYRLFRAATLLGPLEDELSKIAGIERQLELLLRQKQKLSSKVSDELADLKVQYDATLTMRNFSEQIEKEEVLLVWAEAEEEEERLSVFRSKLQSKIEIPLAECDKKIPMLEAEQAACLETLRRCNESLGEQERRCDEATDAAGRAKKRLDLRQAEMNNKRKDLEECAYEINSKTEDLEKAQRDLENAKAEHLRGQEHRPGIMTELHDVVAKIKEKESTIQSCDAELKQLSLEYQEARRDAPKYRSDLDRIARELDERNRDIARVQSDAKAANQVARFGRHLPEVLAVVDRYVNQGRFEYPPIGPIGRYISVRDDIWAATVQQVVGDGVLVSFVVSGPRDMATLKRAFAEARVGVKPKCILVQQRGMVRERYHIDPRCIPNVHAEGHCTVMDMIEVRHDTVFNVLVDHCAIEGNVLVRGEDALTALGSRGDPNIRCCWDEAGARSYTRNRSSVLRPSDRSPHFNPVLSKDLGAVVENLRRAARSLADEKAQAAEAHRKHQMTIEDLKQKIRQVEFRFKTLRSESRTLEQRRLELEEKSNASTSIFDSSPYDSAISVLEHEIEDAKSRKRSIESELSELTSNVEALKGDVAAAKAQARAAKEALNGIAEETSRAVDSRRKHDTEIRNERNKKRDLEAKLEIAREELKEQECKYVKALEVAREVQADRPSRDERNSAAIHANLQALKNRLEQEEERNGGRSAEDIEEEYLVATQKSKENDDMLQRIVGYHDSIRGGLARRQVDLKKMDKKIKRLVRSHFDLFLRNRGHRGEIKFSTNDKGERELRITTRMANHRRADGEQHVTEDTRSLSGGEKSFTTLSFMLALAEVCQNPVRIMDEPDVFLDDASRNTAYKTLIEYCTRYLPDKQVILVTPLTLPNITTSNSVRVVRLRARKPHASAGQMRIDDFA